MSDKQMLAIRCAYADLVGALEAHEMMDSAMHDWKAHKLTIEEMKEVFPFVSGKEGEQQ